MSVVISNIQDFDKEVRRNLVSQNSFGGVNNTHEEMIYTRKEDLLQEVDIL